jgi:type II secretory pathway predicted ATPase ExeA
MAFQMRRNNMYRQFFGLKNDPLGKDCSELWDNGQIAGFEKQFKWLLHSPGVGLLISEPGLGKTAMLRHVISTLNPHKYLIYYIAETAFGRLDFYRHLAIQMGLAPSYYRSQLWRDIKGYITQLYTSKNVLPVILIDEAHYLSNEFLRDLPSFINFVIDSKDYVTIWLIGHPELARIVDRPINTALSSRISARYELKPIIDRESFKKMITHAFTQAGCVTTLLTESGIELIRMASKGNPRQANRVIITSLNLATDKNISHLPDDIIKEAIDILKQG